VLAARESRCARTVCMDREQITDPRLPARRPRTMCTVSACRRPTMAATARRSSAIPGLPGDVYAVPLRDLRDVADARSPKDAGRGRRLRRGGPLDSQEFRPAPGKQLVAGDARPGTPEPPTGSRAGPLGPGAHRASATSHHSWEARPARAQRLSIAPATSTWCPPAAGPRGWPAPDRDLLLARLREQGSPGSAPGVRPLANPARRPGSTSYRHLGFTELAASDMHMFAMDLRGAASRRRKFRPEGRRPSEAFPPPTGRNEHQRKVMAAKQFEAVTGHHDAGHHPASRQAAADRGRGTRRSSSSNAHLFIWALDLDPRWTWTLVGPVWTSAPGTAGLSRPRSRWRPRLAAILGPLTVSDQPV